MSLWQNLGMVLLSAQSPAAASLMGPGGPGTTARLGEEEIDITSL